jgi:hypothetical protein
LQFRGVLWKRKLVSVFGYDWKRKKKGLDGYNHHDSCSIVNGEAID